MSLKRPASAVDEVFGVPPAKVAHTELGVDEMSDTEFDDWLKQQRSTPGHENLFRDDMLQIWMKLTTAATKAQVKYTENLYGRFKTSRPERSEFLPPGFTAGVDPDHELAHRSEADIDRNVEERQAAWQAEQDRIEEMHQKPLTLVERAERVQTKMFAATEEMSKEDEEEVEKDFVHLHVVEEEDGSKTYYRSLGTD
tara:strand:- start:510 stop:1100 length:591 start_codon:yes stop_codon:yes gene_type:complete